MSLEVVANQPPPESKFNKLWLTVPVLGLVLILSLALAWWLNPKLLSPLVENPQVLGIGGMLAEQEDTKVVYGFLPYWNFKYEEELDFSALTHLAIFGLSYEVDGSIQTRENDYQEPGWRHLNGQQIQRIIDRARESDVQITLTMTAFSNRVMDSILLDPEARARCISETIAFVEAQGYDGINLDFEYVGSPGAEVRQAFTVFTQDLAQALYQSNPEAHLSVSVYADSADNNRLWEIDAIGEVIDHLVVMTYDFHRPASSTAGPVAPIFGAGSLWQYDIVGLLSKHLEKNPSYKILLGVPFYGYEWRTSSMAYQSPTIARTGRTASYRRVMELLADDPQIQVNWNGQALSPWLSYTRDDLIYQIYFEDIRSLGFKYDLVNQSELGGIAIWALGYEGEHPEIWEQIKGKL